MKHTWIIGINSIMVTMSTFSIRNRITQASHMDFRISSTDRYLHHVPEEGPLWKNFAMMSMIDFILWREGEDLSHPRRQDVVG
jgi:hypothetical protein